MPIENARLRFRIPNIPAGTRTGVVVSAAVPRIWGGEIVYCFAMNVFFGCLINFEYDELFHSSPKIDLLSLKLFFNDIFLKII